MMMNEDEGDTVMIAATATSEHVDVTNKNDKVAMRYASAKSPNPMRRRNDNDAHEP
jgi:hypothetical protein